MKQSLIPKNRSGRKGRVLSPAGPFLRQGKWAGAIFGVSRSLGTATSMDRPSLRFRVAWLANVSQLNNSTKYQRFGGKTFEWNSIGNAKEPNPLCKDEPSCKLKYNADLTI